MTRILIVLLAFVTAPAAAQGIKPNLTEFTGGPTL